MGVSWEAFGVTFGQHGCKDSPLGAKKSPGRGQDGAIGGQDKLRWAKFGPTWAKLGFLSPFNSRRGRQTRQQTSEPEPRGGVGEGDKSSPLG